MDNQIRPNYKAFTTAIKDFDTLMEGMGFIGAGELFDKIDQAACTQYGFGSEDRFELSMQETYNRLEKGRGERPDPSIQGMIHEIGHSIHSYPFVLLEGAENCLQAWYSRYNIAIVTKGNKQIQRRKLKESGADKYVDAVAIMERKNTIEWVRFLDHNLGLSRSQYASTWAIGNSVKSDINPPLRLGLNAAWVNNGESWEFETEPLERTTQELLIVNSISDLQPIL